MSKRGLRYHLIFLVMFLCLRATNDAAGQAFEAEVKLDPATSIASISGRFPGDGVRNLSFPKAIAGHRDLAKRVRSVHLFDLSGSSVPFRTVIDGEFLSDRPFNRYTYQIDLTPSKNRSAAAHVSWFADRKGIFMLADLLPQLGDSGKSKSLARITFITPVSFDTRTSFIHSSETERDGGFDVSNPEDAVFYIGYDWLGGNSPERRTGPLDVSVSGSWNFDAIDASHMSQEIYQFYERMFGQSSIGRPFIAISKFPAPVGFGEWQAETRGRNVTIVSSDMPFRTQSLQRLHEQLRHEIFHLWIPNGINLTGNYGWFYEGFALYESLRVAVMLNRIRFEDLLDTLSRAHTIDSAQSQRTSLIEMSVNRFSDANTQVYARGMLVAFLCDLALLEQSKGKRSVEYLLTELVAKHRKPADPADANTTILALLRSNPNIAPIVAKYIAGADKLDWANELSVAGLEDADTGPLTNLRVKEKLNGRQKALLDKLGYNNWRKLSPTSK